MKSREGPPPWSLTMTGPVKLRDPQGNAVPLATRKAVGLLAALAAAEGKPLAREVLQDALWPGVAPEKQAQSLRTALAAIRRRIGEDGPVEITRRTCRLRRDRIDVDFPPGSHEGWAHLATDQDGPWFEDLRQGRVSFAPSRVDPDNPEDRLAKVLNWAADIDPERALDLMRAAPELATLIPAPVLSELVDRLWPFVDPNRPLFGWLLHFRGITEYLRGEVNAGLQSFTLAAQNAMASGDSRLVGEAIRWFSAPRTVMGDAEGAARAIEKSLDMVRSRTPHDEDAIAMILHGKAVADVHLLRAKEGDAALVEALQSSYYRRNIPARAQLLANMALFRAVDQNEAGVEEINREIHRCGVSTNWRVAAAQHLAQAILALAKHDPAVALPDLDVIISRPSQGQFTAIDVYAREYAAIACIQQGNLAEARRHFAIANEMRIATQMGLTAWDRKRLAALQALRT